MLICLIGGICSSWAISWATTLHRQLIRTAGNHEECQISTLSLTLRRHLCINWDASTMSSHIFCSKTVSSSSDIPNMKTTCGSNSCSAVNSSLPRCGDAGPQGYKTLCPCVESGRKCRCKRDPELCSRTKVIQLLDPRHLSCWPKFRRLILVSAAVIPVVWLVTYLVLKWHYNLV